MTFMQLIAKLNSATSFFSLSGVEPKDMAAAFQQVETRLDALEALYRRQFPPKPPGPDAPREAQS